MLEKMGCLELAEDHTFSCNGVQEINTTKSSSNDRIDFVTSSVEADSSSLTNMREDISLSHFNESKLTVVAVSKEVYSIKVISPSLTGGKKLSSFYENIPSRQCRPVPIKRSDSYKSSLFFSFL